MDAVTEVIVSGASIEALAAKLEAIEGDLSDEERGLLVAVFGLAGEAMAAHAGGEVSGFSNPVPVETLTLNYERVVLSDTGLAVQLKLAMFDPATRPVPGIEGSPIGTAG